MRELVTELHCATGMTIVMVTHDQREALMLADRIAVMSAGRIVQVGTPQEIYEHPATLEIARYFTDGDVLSCEVADGVLHVGSALELPCALPEGGLSLVLREDALVVGAGGADARVEGVEYVGRGYLATLALGDVRVHKTFPACDAPEPGALLPVAIDVDKALVFPSGAR